MSSLPRVVPFPGMFPKKFVPFLVVDRDVEIRRVAVRCPIGVDPVDHGGVAVVRPSRFAPDDGGHVGVDHHGAGARHVEPLHHVRDGVPPMRVRDVGRAPVGLVRVPVRRHALIIADSTPKRGSNPTMWKRRKVFFSRLYATSGCAYLFVLERVFESVVSLTRELSLRSWC